MQLDFFLDLHESDFVSHFAMVHSRFSTNTFPNWALCQPFRFLSHNGEINTLNANVFNLSNREKSGLGSPVFDAELFREALPILPHTTYSDSQGLDHFVEALYLGSNRSLAECMLMTIPQAWNQDKHMSEEQSAFFQYNSSLLESWDGPACVAFTSGNQIGALLDRNGLRPCRYLITKDHKVILASEVGVVPQVDESRVLKKGRLEPGKILLLDFDKQTIIDDDDVKSNLASSLPYQKWIKEETITLKKTTSTKPKAPENREQLLRKLESFGYTQECLDMLMMPMAEKGAEAMFSMGNDTPLAILSQNPRVFFDYFHQNFSQVTNPPLDSLRERNVMSLSGYIGGKEYPLFADQSPDAVRRLWLDSPLIDPEQMKSLRASRQLKHSVIDTTFNVDETLLLPRMKEICEEACKLVEEGKADLLILSDTATCEKRAPIPSLLMLSMLNTEMSKRGLLAKTGIVIESGEVFDVHHLTCLVSFGAAAVHPYLAYQVIDMISSNTNAYANYGHAIDEGIYKIMSKVGICTVQSYRNSGAHDIIGLSQDVMDACFPRHQTALGGLSFEQIARETLERHKAAFEKDHTIDVLPNPGEYHYRANVQDKVNPESHVDTPKSIVGLQKAAKSRSAKDYEEFSVEHNKNIRETQIRGQFEYVEAEEPLPLEAVESVQDILKRIRSGAMSYGSISEESHKALGVAMNRMGAMSNSGEGFVSCCAFFVFLS